MSSIRTIQPIPMPYVTPAELGPVPQIEWVDPRSLSIEDGYQRQLSDRSMALIHRIVAEFSWSAYKPPIVARTIDGRAMVIDGQHTAIGAASHPGIDKIPVLIVAADAMVDRAKSFLRHNRDRVAMTHLQIHHAAVAAGDEIAVAVEEACGRASVRILRSPQINNLRVGDTMAITTISAICKEKGVVYTARLLKILVDAKLAPLDARSIKAVHELLTDKDYRDTFEPDALSLLIRSKPVEEWVAWAEINIGKGLQMSKAQRLARAWHQKVKKRRAA